MDSLSGRGCIVSDNRKRRPSTSRPDPVEPFISFTLPELLALTERDHRELDALSGRSDGLRTWWALRRLEWREQEGAEE